MTAGEKVQIAGMELCAGAVQSPRWRVSVASPLRPDTGAIVALTRQLVGALSGPPVAIKPWQEGLRRGLQQRRGRSTPVITHLSSGGE